MSANDSDTINLATRNQSQWTLQDADARQFIANAVRATASLVRTTYGPKGLEKLIETQDTQNQDEIVLTSDAGRIMDAIERGSGFGHPITAIFVDGTDGMRKGIHDGTTAAVLLTEALFSQGLSLIQQGLEPSSVIIGYSIAQSFAGETLDTLARPLNLEDAGRLTNVAATTMTTLSPTARERIAPTVAKAAQQLADASETEWLNTDDVRILAAPDVENTTYRGLVLSRPNDGDPNGQGAVTPCIEPGIAIIDREIDFEDTATVLDGGDGVHLSSADALQQYQSELQSAIRQTATRLADIGVDTLVCMEKVDTEIAHQLEKAGISLIDKAKYPKEDIYRLARATGGNVVGKLTQVESDDLGYAARVSQQTVDDEVWTLVEGCSGPVISAIIGGATPRSATQYENAAEDALETIAVAAMDAQILPGAGAAPAAVSAAIRDRSTAVSGREQLAVKAFAEAIEILPATLITNSGHQPLSVLPSLRAAHADSNPVPTGVDHRTGSLHDAYEAGIIEPRRVFSLAIDSAVALTERLLTVDDVLYPNVDIESFEPIPERD